MDLYNLNYILSHNGLCEGDFKRADTKTTINLDFMSSLSELLCYSRPFSGEFVAKFSALKMNNGDIFYIREEQYLPLYEYLKTIDKWKK